MALNPLTWITEAVYNAAATGFKRFLTDVQEGRLEAPELLAIGEKKAQEAIEEDAPKKGKK
jgi:hypothetical protein